MNINELAVISVKSYPCLLSLYGYRIAGEYFRGVASLYRVGDLETGKYYLLALDKATVAEGVQLLDEADIDGEVRSGSVWASAKWIDVNSRQITIPPVGARRCGVYGGPGIAEEKDYYDRILPALRSLESGDRA
jgi:hypothetical protein